VERQRAKAITTNREELSASPAEGLPAVDKNTMTLRDRAGEKSFLSDRAQKALDLPLSENSHGDILLRRVELTQTKHEELAEPEHLLSFLVENEPRLRDILRPPFANFSELKRHPKAPALRKLRDPRRPRDRQHDMRMPPYMRDSDYSALSITRRQWQHIHELIQILKKDLSSFSQAEARTRAYQSRKKKDRK